MYFLESICEMSNLDPVWNIIGFVVKAIWIGVPILLIIYGMLDLGKAVIASKEDEVKKAWKAFGRRFLVAIGVFAVVAFLILGFSDEELTKWIITLILAIAFIILGFIGIIDYKKNK